MAQAGPHSNIIDFVAERRIRSARDVVLSALFMELSKKQRRRLLKAVARRMSGDSRELALRLAGAAA